MSPLTCQDIPKHKHGEAQAAEARPTPGPNPAPSRKQTTHVIARACLPAIGSNSALQFQPIYSTAHNMPFKFSHEAFRRSRFVLIAGGSSGCAQSCKGRVNTTPETLCARFRYTTTVHAFESSGPAGRLATWIWLRLQWTAMSKAKCRLCCLFFPPFGEVGEWFLFGVF